MYPAAGRARCLGGPVCALPMQALLVRRPALEQLLSPTPPPDDNCG